MHPRSGSRPARCHHLQRVLACTLGYTHTSRLPLTSRALRHRVAGGVTRLGCLRCAAQWNGECDIHERTQTTPGEASTCPPYVPTCCRHVCSPRPAAHAARPSAAAHRPRPLGTWTEVKGRRVSRRYRLRNPPRGFASVSAGGPRQLGTLELSDGGGTTLDTSPPPQ